MHSLLNWIINSLKTVDTANVTIMITLLVILIAVFGIINRLRTQIKVEPTVIPSMLSSLGILGTFIGITVGLLNFDTTNIESSVPLLLAGLQSAFITSLAGMGASISYKFICSVVIKNTPLTDDDGTDVQMLARRLDTLIDQGEDVKLDVNNMTSGIDDVTNAIRQHEQSNKRYDNAILKSMKKTNDILQEGPGEQMVEALASAAEKFNDVLENQIGKSFEKLNTGVTNLLEWQEQHKNNINSINKMNTTLETLPANLKESVALSGDIMAKVQDSIMKSERNIEMYKEESSFRITTLSDSMEQLVDNARNGLQKVATSANDAIVFSRKNHEELNATQKMLTSTIDNAVERSTVLVDSHNNAYKQMLDSNDQILEMKRAQEQMLREFGSEVQGILDTMSQQTSKLVQHIVNETRKGTKNV